MESSDVETGMVDCGVGTIVWVRRRNGSWWPGKILGPDELSASHVMSPRSGTPVKLLGREDASVDWYNLEKSKRVKPFRCGEFDDCIERAEASQGMPPKKREKYARREDAILHALELEKQVLEKKYGKSGVQSNGLSTKLLGNDTTIIPEFSRNNGKHVDPSLDDKRKGLSFQSRRADSGSHLNVDDKSPDVCPSFRGLQDLGAGPIPFKHKLSSLAASNGSHSHRHAAAAAASDGVSHSLTPENSVIVSSKKLLEKRKRSQEGNMEESVGKRRDRHRPLVQVLQSSAKLPRTHLLRSKADGGEELREAIHLAVGDNDPGIAVKSGDSFDHRGSLPDQVEISAPKSFPVALSEDNTTGSNEDTETDSTGTESLLSDTYDAMAALSDEGEDMEFIPKAFGRSERQGEDESMSDNESGDSAVTVSKWQLKGKRNSRSLRKRKLPMSCSHWMIGFKGEDSFGADSNSRNQGIGGYNNDNNNNNNNNSSNRAGGGLEMSWDDEPKGYWDEYDDVMRSMLIDVEVGVQSLGYQREHVPMISLMSKLNDKAIVGHPISIEALEDGSSDIILSDFQMESFPLLASDPPTLQPWRTPKCRVSRQPNLSTLEEEEDEEYEYHNEDGKWSAGSLNHSSKGRKWAAPKKPQRRCTSSSSSQKIRTLSSIGGNHHQQQQQQQQIMDMKAAGEEGIGIRMMKPESLPTAVACIPVKLVFSRLHEELLVARHQ